MSWLSMDGVPSTTQTEDSVIASSLALLYKQYSSMHAPSRIAATTSDIETATLSFNWVIALPPVAVLPAAPLSLLTARHPGSHDGSAHLLASFRRRGPANRFARSMVDLARNGPAVSIDQRNTCGLEAVVLVAVGLRREALMNRPRFRAAPMRVASLG